MPWFDQWGWASLTEIPGRFTPTPLPENIPEGQAANWTGYEWLILPRQPAVVHTAGPRRITKLAFRNRFTQAEKVAIELAAADDPAAPAEQRLLAATLRANLADQRDAEFIDLDFHDTQIGVQTLENHGLIGPGRADTILGAAIQPHEAFEG